MYIYFSIGVGGIITDLIFGMYDLVAVDVMTLKVVAAGE